MAIKIEILSDHDKFAMGSVIRSGKLVARYQTEYNPMDGDKVAWRPWAIQPRHIEPERYATYTGALVRLTALTMEAFNQWTEADLRAQTDQDLDQMVDEITS